MEFFILENQYSDNLPITFKETTQFNVFYTIITSNYSTTFLKTFLLLVLTLQILKNTAQKTRNGYSYLNDNRRQIKNIIVFLRISIQILSSYPFKLKIKHLLLHCGKDSMLSIFLYFWQIYKKRDKKWNLLDPATQDLSSFHPSEQNPPHFQIHRYIPRTRTTPPHLTPKQFPDPNKSPFNATTNFNISRIRKRQKSSQPSSKHTDRNRIASSSNSIAPPQTKKPIM